MNLERAKSIAMEYIKNNDGIGRKNETAIYEVLNHLEAVQEDNKLNRRLAIKFLRLSQKLQKEIKTKNKMIGSMAQEIYLMSKEDGYDVYEDKYEIILMFTKEAGREKKE